MTAWSHHPIMTRETSARILEIKRHPRKSTFVSFALFPDANEAARVAHAAPVDPAENYFNASNKVSDGEHHTGRASPNPFSRSTRACHAAEGMSPSACSP